MTVRERTGATFTSEQLAFRYPELFLGSATTDDPTVVDVHTQPTDEGGATVGRVLHVGTGNARPLLVTFDTGVGARVYVGLVSSYHEQITEKFERPDVWASSVRARRPVVWAQDLMP